MALDPARFQRVGVTSRVPRFELGKLPENEREGAHWLNFVLWELDQQILLSAHGGAAAAPLRELYGAPWSTTGPARPRNSTTETGREAE